MTEKIKGNHCDNIEGFVCGNCLCVFVFISCSTQCLQGSSLSFTVHMKVKVLTSFHGSAAVHLKPLKLV